MKSLKLSDLYENKRKEKKVGYCKAASTDKVISVV